MPDELRLREREREAEQAVSVESLRTTSETDALLSVLANARPAFVAFASRRLGSAADAEDVVQQAMLRATTTIDALRDRERVVAWFYRVLRNMIADHLASRARRDARLAPLDEEVESRAVEEPPADVCGCGLSLLEGLRGEYADVVRRVDLEEEPLDEVARALTITSNNAKVRLHRARNALRSALAARCGTDSARACADCSCDA